MDYAVNKWTNDDVFRIGFCLTLVIAGVVYWLSVVFFGGGSLLAQPFNSNRHNIEDKVKKGVEDSLREQLQGQEMSATVFRAVFVTVPSAEVGKKIAHGLVSNKLAACVNIIPQITSVYEWEGKIEEDSEQLLMIKSKEDLFEELSKFVKDNHPYDVPEIIALPLQQGFQPYLDWISQITKKKES